MITRNKKIVFIYSLIFLLVSAIFILAVFFPSYGNYEWNIYRSYPLYFWVLIILCISLSTGISFYEIYKYPDKYNWLVGFSLLLLINVFLISLPFARNYAFASAWDTASHYGYILDILRKGVPSDFNFYPIAHLSAMSFMFSSSLDLYDILLVFPIFYYLIYICNTAFAAWVIDKRPSVRGMILLISLPLIYQAFTTVYRPVQYAVFFAPYLVGLLFIKYNSLSSWKDNLLLVLILIFLPFLHPWGVIFSFVLMIAYYLSYRFICKFSISVDYLTTMIFILFITWFTWFSSFRLFGVTLKTILISFAEGLTGEYSINSLTLRAQQVDLPASKIISLIVFTYGTSIIYVIIAVLVGAILFLKFVRKKVLSQYANSMSLTLLIVVFLFLAFLTLFRNLISEGPFRVINFISAIIPLQAGIVIYEFSDHPKNIKLHKKVLVGVCSAIAITSILSVFSIFNSGLNGLPNFQASYDELAGLRFLIDKSVKDDRLITSPFKGMFLLPSLNGNEELFSFLEQDPRFNIIQPPAHFGYDGVAVDHGFDIGYLFLTAYDYSFFTDVWPEGSKYTKDDIKSLGLDPYWDLSYSSGDFQLWWHKNGK